MGTKATDRQRVMIGARPGAITGILSAYPTTLMIRKPILVNG